MIVKYKNWIVVPDENLVQYIPKKYNHHGFARYKIGNSVTYDNVVEFLTDYMNDIMLPQMNESEDKKHTAALLTTALYIMIKKGSNNKIDVNSFYDSPEYNWFKFYLTADPNDACRLSHTLEFFQNKEAST